MRYKILITIFFLFFFEFNYLNANDELLIGEVQFVNLDNGEILIKKTNPQKELFFGDTLYLRINSEILSMKITMPMFTSTKCRLDRKYFNSIELIKKGFKVYQYNKKHKNEEKMNIFSNKHKFLENINH